MHLADLATVEPVLSSLSHQSMRVKALPWAVIKELWYILLFLLWNSIFTSAGHV